MKVNMAGKNGGKMNFGKGVHTSITLSAKHLLEITLSCTISEISRFSIFIVMKDFNINSQPFCVRSLLKINDFQTSI